MHGMGRYHILFLQLLNDSRHLHTFHWIALNLHSVNTEHIPPPITMNEMRPAMHRFVWNVVHMAYAICNHGMLRE